ncbi:hypothetical protein DM02DRAFT_675103 [Periconia macrospinosa]|uniref:Rhodopsin domain-containing protein n=1 Tax=Periconia macrospinosa TaxID=97972 RepID=A0A2V1DDD6_9PLEO|nr:hypothetical protein DM02DRAFT_675103 [Periconia macrospinosa]
MAMMNGQVDIDHHAQIAHSLATIGLLFRFYVRLKCFRKLLADDYIAGFAWLLLLISACIWYMTIDGMYELSFVSAGMALPTADFPHNAHRFLVGSNVALIMFYVGLWSIKISFLVFFYRLGENFRPYQICWWIVLVCTIGSGLVCIGDIQYHCLSDSFDKVFSKCASENAIRFQEVTIKLNCALDVVTDVMIMALPISILWSVRVGLSRKIFLGAIFSLVVITMTFAIVRVTVVSKGYTTTQQGGRHQAEITWLYFWSFIEFAVAVIVASLASFRALFAQKNRESEAEEARKREIIEREASNSKSKALWARAKYFQQSLLETMKAEIELTKQETTDDSTLPLKNVSFSDHGLLEETHSGQSTMR